jgi:tetratricopeptide (TPR) repeat protein
MSRRYPLVVALFLLTPFSGAAQAFDDCGDLRTHYGPYDYWVDKDKLGIVESYHFTPDVENLRSGSTGYVGSDLDYTLHAFPNHPRALLAMVRLGERKHTDRPKGARLTVYCYLERAIRFRPQDAWANMIMAMYLAKHKRGAEALPYLRVAGESAADNANLQYDIGLVYCDLGRFDDALKHARIAYRLKFPLPGLKEKLVKAGKWKEPPPVDNAKPTPDTRGDNGAAVASEAKPETSSATSQ